MKKILYLFVIMAALVDSWLLPLNFLLLWCLFWSIFVDDRQGLTAALVGGFLIDCFTISPFGSHALALVIAVSIVLCCMRLTAIPRKYLVLVCYGALGVVVYQWLSLVFQMHMLVWYIPKVPVIVDIGLLAVIMAWLHDRLALLYKKPLRATVSL